MSEVQAKADRCHKLLEDTDLQQAFKDVRNVILQGFSETPPTDTEQLTEWRRRLLSLDSVEQNLMQAVKDGQLERFRQAEQEQPPYLGDILKWRKKQK